MTPSGWRRGVAGIERLSSTGLDVGEFRTSSLRQLRTLLSVDAAFFATVDPATLLFTSALAEEPLAAATPEFLDNEFGGHDVNRFAELAGSDEPVRSLDQATSGHRSSSDRYQAILAPRGLGDELRMALVSAGRCWGVLCLHREDGVQGFAPDEIALLASLAPHLAEGLRRGVALYPVSPDQSTLNGPGIIVLEADLSVASVNARARHWLGELAETDWSSHAELPLSIYAAAAQALGQDPERLTEPAPTRLRRTRGGWITLHASALRGAKGSQVAVILDAADASQLGSLALAAHGLTPAQTRVAALVLQGRSTRSIVAELHITSNTMQEHLRAVFDQFGVGSRRELIAALSGRPH